MFGVARAGGSPRVVQAPRAAHERFLVPCRGPLMARGGGPLTVRSPICDFFFFSISSNKTFFYFFSNETFVQGEHFLFSSVRLDSTEKNLFFVLIELFFLPTKHFVPTEQFVGIFFQWNNLF